jgi:hypothetical protein
MQSSNKIELFFFEKFNEDLSPVLDVYLRGKDIQLLEYKFMNDGKLPYLYSQFSNKKKFFDSVVIKNDRNSNI